MSDVRPAWCNRANTHQIRNSIITYCVVFHLGLSNFGRMKPIFKMGISHNPKVLLFNRTIKSFGILCFENSQMVLFKSYKGHVARNQVYFNWILKLCGSNPTGWATYPCTICFKRSWGCLTMPAPRPPCRYPTRGWNGASWKSAGQVWTNGVGCGIIGGTLGLWAGEDIWKHIEHIWKHFSKFCVGRSYQYT